jgi:ankyrin repeat protein
VDTTLPASIGRFGWCLSDAGLSQSDCVAGTLNSMPIQWKTIDPNGNLSSSLIGIISFAILLTCGCSRDQATQSSRAPKDPVRRTGEVVASISEQAFRDAALKGEIKTVREAIEQKVELDAADAEGRTALQLASYDGHTDVVRTLLDCNSVIDHRDGVGRTALMYAASGSNHETVRVLLEAGADPNIRDKVEQFTALMFAAAEGQLEVVQTLLDHGADVTLSDVDGDTALDFASQNGHSDVARLLSQ